MLYLVALIPFSLACLVIISAVFGKAFMNFPYQPDEFKVFTRQPVPRKHLICFLTIKEIIPRKKRQI